MEQEYPKSGRSTEPGTIFVQNRPLAILAVKTHRWLVSEPIFEMLDDSSVENVSVEDSVEVQTSPF